MNFGQRTLFSFLLFVLSLGLCAQEFPYDLDWQREATLLTLGAGFGAVGYTIESQLEGLTPENITQLRRSNVWFFDRGATRQESETFRTLSDKLLRGAMLLPATLALNKRVRKRGLVLATMLAETALLSEGLTKMTKVLIRRNRPLTYNLSYNAEKKLSHDARQSFISGHTTNSAALSFFTAKVFHDLNPQSPWRHLVWAGAAAVPLVTGYARYRAGKHFPTDIMAGYAVGAAIGILVPQWHKQTTDRGVSVGIVGDGLGLSVKW